MRKTIDNDEMLDILKEAKQKAKKRQLTTISNKSQLTTEEKFKISLCRFFVQYLNEHKMKPIDLHKQTGIEQSRISEILHYKITKFTIDKLLVWLNVLAKYSPKIKEHLHFLEEAMSMPIMAVNKTKKLTRDMKKVSMTGTFAH
jgi:predicted XRE-type DNA-binding protein